MASMRTKRPKKGRSAEATSISSIDQDTDDAVKAMFRLTPQESRRIIEDTSPNQKAKSKKK